MSRNIKHFRDSEGPNGSRHLDEDVLIRFFNRELDESAVNQVFRHLNRCDLCRHTAILYFHQIQTEENLDDILKEFEDHPSLNASHILDRLFPPPKPDKAKRTRNPLVKICHWLFSPDAGLRWAAALATIVLIVVIWGIPAYKHGKSTSLLNQSRLLMTEKLAISDREALRPSGGFEYAEFGITRGASSESEAPWVVSLKKAIELNPRNAEAYQLLGAYYLCFKSNPEQAEMFYTKALSIDSTLASVYNDLGVLQWKRSECKSAIPFFKKALKYQPDLKEALYNLAMVYQHFPEFRQEALATWEAYLKLDSDSNWSKIARMHLERLKEQ
ncbi:MAG: tetratricopeptide repeat protein [candidate division KSB1 bacterium]|nr:tetratricopeptide repeat protein [candidate division KSB1 bacterium]MDQ7062841.1 tetratricopeptide repeat protein [candidate division KSB1 bacterium]